MKEMCTCTQLALLCAGVGLAMAVPSFAQSLRTDGPISIKGLDALQQRSMRVQPSLKDGGIAGANPACPNLLHSCCTTGGVGCFNSVCCNIVCDLDPFCCSVSWDGLCVGGANTNCTAADCAEGPVVGPCSPPNANEECETATNLGVIGSNTAVGTAICAAPDCAPFTFGEGNLWLTFETLETRNVVISYCGSVNNSGGPWGNAWLNLSFTCPCTGFSGAGSFAFDCPDGNVNITFANLPAGVYYYPILIDSANSAKGAYNINVSSGKAVPVCPNDDHDCCTVGTPGCSDQACCEAICLADPFCCQVSWDTLCVNQAVAAGCCKVAPVCPNEDHDCLTTGTPGCSDEKCCNIVCNLDPFCCQTAWDGICVNEALANCNIEPPSNDNCVDRLAISEVCDMPFTTAGATTDGPSHASCLDVAGDGQVNQDIWYNYTASCTGNATISLCGSLYDTKLAVYSGCGCPVSDANKLACNDDFCGLQSEVVIPVIAGSCYKVRIGGYLTSAGSGVLTINNDGVPCSGSDCLGDTNNDGVVDVEDLLNVINTWGDCDP